MEEYEKELEEISEKLRVINPVFTDEALLLLYSYFKVCKEREETQKVLSSGRLHSIFHR